MKLSINLITVIIISNLLITNNYSISNDRDSIKKQHDQQVRSTKDSANKKHKEIHQSTKLALKQARSEKDPKTRKAMLDKIKADNVKRHKQIDKDKNNKLKDLYDKHKKDLASNPPLLKSPSGYLRRKQESQSTPVIRAPKIKPDTIKPTRRAFSGSVTIPVVKTPTRRAFSNSSK